MADRLKSARAGACRPAPGSRLTVGTTSNEIRYAESPARLSHLEPSERERHQLCAVQPGSETNNAMHGALNGPASSLGQECSCATHAGNAASQPGVLDPAHFPYVNLFISLTHAATSQEVRAPQAGGTGSPTGAANAPPLLRQSHVRLSPAAAWSRAASFRITYTACSDPDSPTETPRPPALKAICGRNE